MTPGLILLYLLVIPYILLLLMVTLGMFLPDRRRREPGDLPSVTVVLPAHNEQERLPATLASLARQEYAGELEFIIVDDRSKDATAEIIDSQVARDPRFRRVSVVKPSRRLSPKVNAVNTGIMASSGEVIVTTDADCEYPTGWVAELVSHFAPGVVMVVGYVETTRAWRARGWLQLFESVDWLSLMLTSRSLTRYGWKFASSANNQAYLRSAFNEARGFGASGRAPSGDEDLLTQRLGRLPDSRVVFASSPASRVVTRAAGSLPELLNQRRRWVSRYHHLIHYQPAFLASIALLGLHSLALSVAVLGLPFYPWAAPWILGLWGAKLLVELTGMFVGTRQLDRRDLFMLPSLLWALAHPFFIGTTVVMSLVRPGDWRGGTSGYRTRYFRRQWTLFRRRVRTMLGRA